MGGPQYRSGRVRRKEYFLAAAGFKPETVQRVNTAVLYSYFRYESPICFKHTRSYNSVIETGVPLSHPTRYPPIYTNDEMSFDSFQNSPSLDYNLNHWPLRHFLLIRFNITPQPAYVSRMVSSFHASHCKNLKGLEFYTHFSPTLRVSPTCAAYRSEYKIRSYWLSKYIQPIRHILMPWVYSNGIKISWNRIQNTVRKQTVFQLSLRPTATPAHNRWHLVQYQTCTAKTRDAELNVDACVVSENFSEILWQGKTAKPRRHSLPTLDPLDHM